MALPPLNPTQITPPRVEFIDPRSGAISREWYRFFLSLRNATQDNQDEVTLSADTASLLATYDAMLAAATQASEVAFDGMVASLESSLNSLQNTFDITPPDLGGTVTSVAASGGTTGLTFTGSPITSSGTLTLGGTLAVASGGTGAATAAGAITNLGATTLGGNMFTLTNPSAVTFPRFNADNTVSALDAATFRTAIGAGTGGGSVTSVSGTGSVNGITLTGTVTTSGNLTLGGTLSGVSLTTQVTGTLPVANGGTGTSTAFTAGSVVFAGVSGVYSQDNANLFWDDTANRLGMGVTSPTYQLHVRGLGQDTAALTDAGNKAGSLYIQAIGNAAGSGGAVLFGTTFGNATPFAAIKGLVVDGATNTTGDLAFSTRNAPADTALTERMKITPGGVVAIGGGTINSALGDMVLSKPSSGTATFALESQGSWSASISATSTGNLIFSNSAATERMRVDASGNVGIGAAANASAILDVQSTAKGFRLPNMTTTQKNAISSPAAGLMVFDTTLAKACIYSGAAWETITSI